jgi:hypothetical protein
MEDRVDLRDGGKEQLVKDDGVHLERVTGWGEIWLICGMVPVTLAARRELHRRCQMRESCGN